MSQQRHIVSVCSTAPHAVTDGYTLRVSRVIEHMAGALPGGVSVVAPVVGSEEAEARKWAQDRSIGLHCIVCNSADPWARERRQVLRAALPAILAEIGQRHGRVAVIAHGIASIVDVHTARYPGMAVADLIDEPSPYIVHGIASAVRRGSLVGAARSCRSYYAYRRSARPALQGYHKVAVVAHDDARRVARLVPASRVAVVPNGVDFPTSGGSLCSSERSQRTLAFHGVYSYEPNEQAALFLIRRVAPVLRRRCPGLRVDLVGRSPTARMLAEGANQGNVCVVGEVESAAAVLRTAAVGVYPIFQRTGIQNKILEAWANGLPVVTTPEVLGVFAEFSPKASRCARTARSVAEFVDTIEGLIGDDRARCDLASAGYDLVSATFTWEAAARQMCVLCTD